MLVPQLVIEPERAYEFKPQHVFRGHTDGFSCVAFSPDGKTLASASQDQTIKLWDVATGKERATLKGTHEVGLRGVQPGRQDAGLGERGPDDQAVGRGDGQGASHPRAHGRCQLRGVQPGRQDAGLGERGKTIKLWDVATGRRRATLKGHTGDVSPWRTARTARRWPRGAMTQTIKLWDVATEGAGHPSGPHRVGAVRGVQSRRQDVGLGERRRTIKLWDVATGKEGPPSKATQPVVRGVQPGRQDARLGELDGTVKLWDVRRARSGPPSRGTTISSSPWHTARTARRWPRERDHTIKLWEVQTGKERATFAICGMDSVAFSPDGKALASGLIDKTVKLWAIPAVKNRESAKSGILA